MADGPLIVQSDKSLLLEVDHPLSGDARRAIAPFAELERAPEHVHTYRLTPLGLWNARAAGHDAEQVVDTLLEFSRYSVPHALLVDVAETMARYGRLQLVKDPAHGLVLHSLDAPVLEEVMRSKKVAPLLGSKVAPDTVLVLIQGANEENEDKEIARAYPEIDLILGGHHHVALDPPLVVRTRPPESRWSCATRARSPSSWGGSTSS